MTILKQKTQHHKPGVVNLRLVSNCRGPVKQPPAIYRRVHCAQEAPQDKAQLNSTILSDCWGARFSAQRAQVHRRLPQKKFALSFVGVATHRAEESRTNAPKRETNLTVDTSVWAGSRAFQKTKDQHIILCMLGEHEHPPSTSMQQNKLDELFAIDSTGITRAPGLCIFSVCLENATSRSIVAQQNTSLQKNQAARWISRIVEEYCLLLAILLDYLTCRCASERFSARNSVRYSRV